MAAKISILLIEDDENQRGMYAEQLRDEGYRVIEAEDGRAGLDLHRCEDPDLVVLDIQMPGMDGLEVLGKILGSGRRVPVILHTAYDRYRQNFMSWAADAYIMKSADLTGLKQAIRGLLHGRPGDRGGERTR